MVAPPLPTDIAHWASSLEKGLHALAQPEADAAQYLIRRGTMRVGLYAPRGHDPQGPHDQDELYIVAEGRGRFVKDGIEVAFEPGSLLFVEAGAAHRFEDFSDDFTTWVVFWGPNGGESESSRSAEREHLA